jgi:hypothetical protein
VASIYADICTQAGVGMVLGRNLADDAGNRHESVDVGELDAWSALAAVGSLYAADGNPVVVSSLGGVVRLDFDYSQPAAYRVYDVAELLKKLNAAYSRQRTQPGLEDGSDGSLVSAGGVQVIVSAIEVQLAELGLGNGMSVFSYGDRLVVRGATAAIDASATILKEMGWEQ